MPELKSTSIRDANLLINALPTGLSLTQKVLAELAKGNCDASKVYKLEFVCVKNLKFLYTNGKNLYEVCK
jgi:hypothetical protein